MKLSEAIEILEALPNAWEVAEALDEAAALRILIEAAKVILDTRLTYDGVPLDLLPGETKE